jgi:hypothetical protein
MPPRLATREDICDLAETILGRTSLSLKALTHRLADAGLNLGPKPERQCP